MTILVVDDDARVRFSTLRVLQKAGYETLEAATGEEGLRLTREQRPGIVLLDVVLPDIDGLTVCRTIKDDPDLKSCYVILLSGQKTLSDEQTDGLEFGADGYIVRPVPNRELVARVRAMIRLRKAEDVLRDYSADLERTMAERNRELREAQEKLLRREKLSILGQMAGSVGHELRTPLATIANAVSYLKTLLTSGDKDILEYLDIIRDEARAAEKFIRDLLDLSRIKSFDRQVIPIADVVTWILTRQPPPEAVQVTLDLPDDLPDLFVDPTHVEQIFINLISNACQAMPQGGTLTIRARPDDGMVSIEVSDTGVGIALEHLNKLFEPLFTTKPKGIGLGLAVSKNLIEVNGGSISVESDAGKGSVFLLRLPAAAGS